MFRHGIASLVLVIFVAGSSVRALDTDEVKRLKERLELLEAKLKLAEKENELLKKEVELLKATPGKDITKKSLSDLLVVDKILTGSYGDQKGTRIGEITVTITERDRRKFKATVVLKQKDVTSTHDAEGEIDGVKFSWKTVGGTPVITADLSIKGEKGDTLDGHWKNSAGGNGTLGLKFAK